MQSLHGKCLQRTKAARVKSDSGNRRLAPLRGCVSLHSSSSSSCLSLLALPGIPGWMQPNIPSSPSLLLPSLPSLPAHLASGFCRSELDLLPLSLSLSLRPSLPSSLFSLSVLQKGLVKVVDVSQK